MPITSPVRVVNFEMLLLLSSLNIEEGFPSLSVSSRNITNHQIQTFGEVNIE